MKKSNEIIIFKKNLESLMILKRIVEEFNIIDREVLFNILKKLNFELEENLDLREFVISKADLVLDLFDKCIEILKNNSLEIKLSNEYLFYNKEKFDLKYFIKLLLNCRLAKLSGFY